MTLLHHPWQRARAVLAALLFISGAAIPARAGEGAPASPAAAAPAQPDEDTRALWRQRCAGCHGEEGRGTDRRHPGKHVPDLHDAAWQAEVSDAQLREMIAEGIPGKHMPAFKARLSAEQIAALALLVRSYRP